MLRTTKTCEPRFGGHVCPCHYLTIHIRCMCTWTFLVNNLLVAASEFWEFAGEDASILVTTWELFPFWPYHSFWVYKHVGTATLINILNDCHCFFANKTSSNELDAVLPYWMWVIKDLSPTRTGWYPQSLLFWQEKKTDTGAGHRFSKMFWPCC